jgi:hypothetical protein
MTDATVQPEQFVAALQAQASCYRRLAKLVEVQHEHVEQNRADALLEVLSARQEEMTRIAAIDASVGSVWRGWSEMSPRLGDGDRRLAETLLAEIRSLLEQINLADQNDSIILQQRKHSVGQQLQQANSARQVNRSYAAAAYGRPASRMDVQR